VKHGCIRNKIECALFESLILARENQVVYDTGILPWLSVVNVRVPNRAFEQIAFWQARGWLLDF